MIRRAKYDAHLSLVAGMVVAKPPRRPPALLKIERPVAKFYVLLSLRVRARRNRANCL